MQPSPLSLYRTSLKNGKLQSDAHQAIAIERLQSLHIALKSYHPHNKKGKRRGNKLRTRLGLARLSRKNKPQGLYLFGGVGRGKSMLMDMFFDSLPPNIKGKRVHFHAFMAEAHKKLHKERQAQITSPKKQKLTPIEKIAQNIAIETSLLCFDEFQITDIADAMILGRLFEALFKEGVVIISTSNTAPDDLYKDGLQRDIFLPFIEIIKDNMDILESGKGTDFRQNRMQDTPCFYNPINDKNKEYLDNIFKSLCENTKPKPQKIHHQKREIIIPQAANKTARFSFEELCLSPLSAADYLLITSHYQYIIIDNIPQFNPDDSNAARRFINLIDALYEHHCKLYISSECPINKLYPEGKHKEEFKRSLSRLEEMQSLDWQKLPHLR